MARRKAKKKGKKAMKHELGESAGKDSATSASADTAAMGAGEAWFSFALKAVIVGLVAFLVYNVVETRREYGLYPFNVEYTGDRYAPITPADLAPSTIRAAYAARNVELPPDVRLVFDTQPITYHKTPDAIPGLFNVRDALEEAVRSQKAEILHQDPLVVQIDDFITPEECAMMIDWAHKLGLQRSVTAGNAKNGKFERPVLSIRTSTNAWCFQECFTDPQVRRLDEKLSELTMLSWKHGELFQLLRYEPGQYYVQHTDFIKEQAKQPGGVRILTLFVYLNDVEQGGETHFPRLNITVTPKAGRVVMWPNVRYGSLKPDMRTEHVALPVIKGEKYGANKWIHIDDFVTPWMKGTTG